MTQYRDSCLGIGLRCQNEGNCKRTDRINGYQNNNCKNQITIFRARGSYISVGWLSCCSVILVELEFGDLYGHAIFFSQTSFLLFNSELFSV